jgi:hypothetical protein
VCPASALSTNSSKKSQQNAEISVIEVGMLEVNKPVLADDPYRLLQYERGVFEVVSPKGQRVRVICPLKPVSDGSLPVEDSTREKGWWRIEKIA